MTDEQAYRLKKTLNQDEGFELKVYEDTLGNLTVGRGHLVLPEDNLKLGDSISKDQAEVFYKKDVNDARNVAQNFTGKTVWDSLSPNRQNVITNMSYNLGGTKLNEFKKFKGALNVGDYDLAENEMLNSIWSNQTGRRAKKLGYRMENDEWGSGIPWYRKAGFFIGDQYDKAKRIIRN